MDSIAIPLPVDLSKLIGVSTFRVMDHFKRVFPPGKIKITFNRLSYFITASCSMKDVVQAILLICIQVNDLRGFILQPRISY